MLYTFPEYTPDLPDFDNPGLTEAKNVIPSDHTYQVFRNLSSSTDAIDAYPRGGISTELNDTTPINFVGNETKIYSLTASTWTDESKGGGYSTANNQIWSFTQFGDFIIATNFADAMQVFQLGVSATFADLGGSPPKAKYLTTVKDFVMAANINDGGTLYPARVQWSGIGDHTSWAASATTQAGHQDLDSAYGHITGIVGGEHAFVFQERAITRMDYVGSPVVFQFSTVEVNTGTDFPNGIVQVGQLIFYIGLDGFYVFDGHTSHPIGANKVDRTIVDNIDRVYKDRVSVAVDYKKKIVCWALPMTGNNAGKPNKLVFYNYSVNAKTRWSYADLEVEMMFDQRSVGYTLDTLDDFLSQQGLSKSIELLPYSLDSDYWKTSTLLFGAFGSSTGTITFGDFSGSPLTAILTTPEYQISEGQRTQINLVRPYVDGSTDTAVTISVGTRNRLDETVSYTPTAGLDSIGDFPMRSNARFHRFSVTIAGGFNDAIGLNVLQAVAAGYR